LANARTSAAADDPAADDSGSRASSTGTSPTVHACCVVPSGSSASTRPMQVHEPAKKCRRSQASTSSDV
jgi:hypothetical protein